MKPNEYVRELRRDWRLRAVSAHCACGCGALTRPGRKYITGHNLKKSYVRTAQQNARLSASMKLAWQTKRKRLPVGTKRLDHDGYVRVKVVSGAGEWEKEHVLVVERLLGRKLRKGEMVHHINRIRRDNSENNLYLCANRAAHERAHRSLTEAVAQVLARGLITFKDGVYSA